MVKYILKRILWMIPVLLGVIFIVFTINHFTPGDPIVNLLSSNYTQEQYDKKAHELGLDRPFLEQYVSYVWGIVTELDLGTSYVSQRAVKTEILERMPNTIKLGLLGTALTVVLAIPLGITSATHQNSIYDYILRVLTIIISALPNFWVALMSIIIVSLKMNLLPASGLDTWKHYVLPVFCLGLGPVGAVVRMMRSSMLEVIRQDYIRTARAKGLTEKIITRRHALKNALIPVVTVVGMQMGMIMGGSILIETIFSIPGLGTLMNSAISSKNYPVIQSSILMISMTVCVMNLVVDIIYAFIDPRIKAQYTSGKEKKKAADKPANQPQEQGVA